MTSQRAISVFFVLVSTFSGIAFGQTELPPAFQIRLKFVLNVIGQ